MSLFCVCQQKRLKRACMDAQACLSLQLWPCFVCVSRTGSMSLYGCTGLSEPSLLGICNKVLLFTLTSLGRNLDVF